MTFETRKSFLSPVPALSQLSITLALLASSIAASLLLLFAVTSLMSDVLKQNSKSNRENFGVILLVLKEIFFIFYIPLLPVRKFWCTIPSFRIIITCIYLALLHWLSSFANTLLKYLWLKGGSGKIKAPDMTPGRGVSYILPLKVFFYAMPFPARQQGGLTGNYVSLPGYTETKQRVRQDHPPLTPLPPPATSTPPTDSLSLCFWHLKFPSSIVVFRNSDLYFLTLFL